MSSLPQFIPPQDAPFAQARPDGKIYVDVNWYLFLYNIAINTLPTNGELPTSEADIIDMIDLDASGTDLPQAFRLNANIGALEAQDIELSGADIANLPTRDNNVQMLQQEADAGPSARDLANVLTLSLDNLLQDPTPLAQPVSVITVGASPFTYAASFDGTLSVTGGAVSSIVIVRQGVTVSTGIAAGIIPLRRLDQVKITYTVLPTAFFLPN